MNDLYGPLDEKKKKRKKAGTESSKESSLRDWFGRKGAKGKKKGWVDCNSPDGKGGYKSCGRGSGEKRKKYPACRPTPGACKERGKGKSWGKKAKKKSKKKNEELHKMDLYQIIEEEIEAVVTETHTKEHEKELEKIADELAGASKMHKGQSDQIKKILDQTEEPEEPVNEGMNCGCGNDPCETYGKNNEKLIIVIKEELSAVREDRQTHIAGITKKIARLEQAIINAEKGMKNMDDSADDDTDLGDVRNSKAYFAKQSEVMNLRDKLEVLEDQLQQLQQDGPVELTRGLEEKESKKDACYNKVKSRYKVWPSAYASGALVKCRKVGAANWGNSKKESLEIMIEDEIAQVLDEKKKKPCKPSKGKRFAKRVDGKCRSFGQKGQAKGGGDRIRPGTAKGDAYCARSAKIKKCKNPPCANALSRKKWKCRGSKSMKEAVRKINAK